MTTATEVRELPILFKGPMVRAILEGRKTQTRRVVKPQPTWNGARWVWPLPKRVHHLMGPGTTSVCSGSREWHEYAPRGSSPYGAPGDLLYVRETFRVARTYDMLPPRKLPGFIGEDFEPFVQFVSDGEGEPALVQHWGKRRQSIFMPKAFARIWLRVTDVRVERVQEIGASDCFAEGVERPACLTDPSVPMLGTEVTLRGNARNAFRDLWDSINADRGHSWESNPWVWCVSFERAEAP